MENATKALIMAAGILIGIIVLSIFAYEFIVIADTGEAYGKEIRQQEIAKFNSQFESYAYEYDGKPRELKAQEVVTLLYLVYDWNQNNESDNVNVSITNSLINKYGTVNNFKYELFLNEKTNSIFECSIDTYDEKGRINGISIREK